jgi:hypothetical protein
MIEFEAVLEPYKKFKDGTKFKRACDKYKKPYDMNTFRMTNRTTCLRISADKTSK